MHAELVRHDPVGPADDPALKSSRALETALRSELRLLEELRQVLLRQRAAVATTDAGAINDSIFVMHRVLYTLAEARRGRRQLSEMFGVLDTGELAALHDELRTTGLAVSREIETNQQILRGVIAAGEELIRVLAGADSGVRDSEPFGAGGVLPYGPSGREGILINRTI